MNFTFGIITNGSEVDRVSEMVRFIEDAVIEDDHDYYTEILIVGGDFPEHLEDLRVPIYHVPFGEATKKNWITRKKNLITEAATCENVVYMHDYIKICVGWFKGFRKFGSNWDVAMNPILTLDGSRYRDWVIWDDPDYEGTPQTALPPYTYNKTQFMYISGAYWVAKREFMIANPFNEDLSWGQGEDVEWSKRVRSNWNYSFNPDSQVQLMKKKEVISRRCY